MENQEHSLGYEICKTLKQSNKRLFISNIGLIIIIITILIKIFFLWGGLNGKKYKW